MSNGDGDPSLRFLRATGRAERRPDCPEEERLRLLAVGLADPAESQDVLAHAAGCDGCGRVLREALEDLSEPPSAEEIQFAINTRLAHRRHRRAFARQLAEPAPPRFSLDWLRRPWTLRLAWGGALAAVLAMLAPSLIEHYSSLAVAQRATNRAYTVANTVPLRFPGVGYASVTVERSVRTSRLRGPAEVLDAEARVKRGVDAHPDDPQWLQLEGRLELLEGNEDAAIAELERARALRAGDPYILSDLGAAYYQKAGKTDDPQFDAQAFESFSKGLKLKANDPVLLFNLARGAQRIMAPHAEQNAWVAYLRADPGGGWAQEARAELDKVRAKLERQRAYSADTRPEALVAELQRGWPWEQLFALDEEYLVVAVKRLLPAYYATPPDKGAGRILHRMADEFVARHQDTWLREVLKTPHTVQAEEGFRALGRAAEAYDAGQWAQESGEADTAVRKFRSVSGKAGELLGELDRLQSLARRVAGCAGEGRTLMSHLVGQDYFWLSAQSSIEATICEFRDMDFEQVWAARNATIKLAKEHAYHALALRALGLRALWYSDVGNRAAAWREDMQGLGTYWSANYPLVRAQFIYSVLSHLAPQVYAAYSAVAWGQETVEITSKLGIPGFHAGALHRLALTEIFAGLREPAEKHLEQYSKEECKLPSDEQQRGYYYVIALAEAENTMGRLVDARHQLESIQEQVKRFGTPLVKLQFSADLGQVRLRLGDYSTSEGLLANALTIGEGARTKLSEEDSQSWTRLMGDTYRALVECDIRRGASPRQAWQKWSTYRAALSSQEGTPNPAGEPVAAGDAMLSFAELPSGIGIWLATPKGLHFQWLAPTVRYAAARLVRNCTTARSPLPVLRADASEVSRWLLGPWEEELRGIRTLVIESDGPLSSLPWDALVLSNGRYWSEEFATRVRVGAGAGSQTRTPVALAKSILAVGAPALEGNQELPPLADALEEAKTVSSLFPRSLLLGGRQATLMELRNRIGDAEIFHFAGHGFGGEGGGLILRGAAGMPALLKAADIKDLHLSRCRLAVLSACSTGAGERNGPGDPRSLVSAFLHAKTGEVVASFWNLNSAASQLLIDHFYRAILSGVPTEQCLRTAAAAVRSQPEYQHPYYWAGLQVFSLH